MEILKKILNWDMTLSSMIDGIGHFINMAWLVYGVWGLLAVAFITIIAALILPLTKSVAALTFADGLKKIITLVFFSPFYFLWTVWTNFVRVLKSLAKWLFS